MKDIKVLVRKYTLQLLDLRNDVSSYLALNGILEETKLNVTSFVRKLNNLQSIYAEIMLYDYPPIYEIEKLYKEIKNAIKDINRYGKIYDELIARNDSDKENDRIIDALINYQITLFDEKDSVEEILEDS
jgi:hypothetical protein